MKDVLSIYHSGVNNTKFVSEKITDFLKSKEIAIENYSVEQFDKEKNKNYEYLIIGFPTYYTKSSKVMSDFIDKLPRYEKPKYAFIYTICGLFSGNALYDFAKKLKTKNIYVFCRIKIYAIFLIIERYVKTLRSTYLVLM